jgi:hypothetical protein
MSSYGDLLQGSSKRQARVVLLEVIFNNLLVMIFVAVVET